MIQQEILLLLPEYIKNPDLLQFMRLSQVNRKFRRAFFSNRAWARFDVYGVENMIPAPLYHYKGYTLSGIAADFFNRWFAYSELQQKSILPKARVVDTNDLYLQLHFLIDTFGFNQCKREKRECRATSQRIRLVVWQLWSPHERAWQNSYGTGVYESLTQELQQNKQVYLGLIKVSAVNWVGPIFANEPDVNLALIKRNPC